MTQPHDEDGKERNTVAMPRHSGTNYHLKQAYSQAPWRIATQRGVLFLIVAILGSSILWVMVSVTIQAATAGLEIQQLEDAQEDLERQIAGRRTDIAILTSATVMKERAAKLGFEPIDPYSIAYFVGPESAGRESTINAPSFSTLDTQPIIKPVYTQSLWEWLLQGILDVGESSDKLIEPVRIVP